MEGIRPTLAIVGECNALFPQLANAQGWAICAGDDAVAEVEHDGAAVVVLGDVDTVLPFRERYPHGLIVSTNTALRDVDLTLPVNLDRESVLQILKHAEDHWRCCRRTAQLVRDVEARRQQMRQLSEIGILLSSQLELKDLLSTILMEARRIAECDAGSLYLVEESGGSRSLVFKLAQNDTIDVPLVERQIPVTPESLAGYVADTGCEINIPDVYELGSEAPFRFNVSFDQQTGYRTRSMLVLPMRDHRERVIGVLQFMNKLDRSLERKHRAVAFDQEVTELLRAVASQAAVAIQKNTLISDINNLFESFVQASVRVIEKRDPSTSGHSFRVAESTVALLQALPMSGLSRFRDLEPTPEHIREVRYAALLHDFGKVSVRENVLVKAKKISVDRLEVIRFRIELQKERLRRRAVERELAAMHAGDEDVDTVRRRIHAELERDMTQLDDYVAAVEQANRPTVLADGDFAHLQTIREYAFREVDGTIGGLINDEDLLALSVRRGSLTPDERREIQSHVVHTRDFLAELPWPPELKQIPAIAGAHHEKLDGSGYPNGLTEEQIPLPSRVMTVCDIYDALTAMDRPYKSAIGVDAAFDILVDEARAGLLDADLVSIFIESRSDSSGRVKLAG